MTSDNLISWLIHSDWFLIGGWILALAIALVVTFTDLPSVLFPSSDSEAPHVPPEP